MSITARTFPPYGENGAMQSPPPRASVSSSGTTTDEIERILAVYGVTREELDAINHLQEVCGDSQGENDMAMAILWSALTGARAELRTAHASLTSSQTDSSLRATEPTTESNAYTTADPEWYAVRIKDAWAELRALGPSADMMGVVHVLRSLEFCRGRALQQRYDTESLAAASPTVTPPEAPNGVSLIAAERQRQIEVEGWTTAHDDTHRSGEMAQAAAVYAWPSPRPFEIKAAWPWPGWFKPTTPEPEETQCGCRSAGDCPHFGTITPDAWRNARIRDLTKAGALIAAEIDRLSRAARSTPTEEKTNAE